MVWKSSVGTICQLLDFDFFLITDLELLNVF